MTPRVAILYSAETAFIAGMNRIVYEVRGDIAYIHVVCDTRKDLKSILLRRLLRSD
ncbi:hypothetical protein [Burkholderia ubonensis]|uniref:hypothetical protein n=1 Tax=Burkholderia ubonensis TaxID=101571 RepID=UPI000A7964E7|nr:hypothetical protein [Burkholderia ubonensis]